MFVILWGLCENEAKHWKNNYTGGVFEIQGVHRNKKKDYRKWPKMGFAMKSKSTNFDTESQILA